MVSVKDIDKGWKNIVMELEKTKFMEVAVGILEGSKNEGVSIAEYASYNEFGTELIPSRPFMAMSFDENTTQIDKDLKKQFDRILQGKTNTIAALTIIGQKHAARIQNTITKRNILPRLAERTIKAKKGSTKTLVDTGAMVSAVQISVRKKQA